MIDSHISPVTPPISPSPTPQTRSAAERLEFLFVMEMLKASGVGEPRVGFGGGIGEEQFGSYLRDAYAEKIMDAGGVGLAEQLVRVMASGSGSV